MEDINIYMCLFLIVTGFIAAFIDTCSWRWWSYFFTCTLLLHASRYSYSYE